MTRKALDKVRLALNGICSLAIAVFCLSFGLRGLIGLLTGARHMGDDPDGGDKVLGIQILCTLLGIVALISVLRTLKVWREKTRVRN